MPSRLISVDEYLLDWSSARISRYSPRTSAAVTPITVTTTIVHLLFLDVCCWQHQVMCLALYAERRNRRPGAQLLPSSGTV